MKNPFSIVYNADGIIIVNKAAGLLSVAGRWEEDESRLDILLAEFLLKNNEKTRPYPVHRLDKDTSGLMMFALNAEIHKNLNLQFSKRDIKKTYHAVVAGAPEKNAFACNAKLKIDGDKLHRSVIDNKHGKNALTEFTVLERFRRFTLLEASPITGRTHQIRAHLKHLGFPILCDALYGNGVPMYLSQIKTGWRGDKYEERPLIKRQALHAYGLEFIHPATGKTVRVTADYPKDLKSLTAQLQKNAKTETPITPPF